MPNSDSLEAFGLILIAIVGAFLVVPILRGSREIITAWNVLLLGIIAFTGIGSIEVKYATSMGFPTLEWFQPTIPEMKWYMWTSGLMVAAILLFYYRFTWAKSFGQRCLRTWPEFSTPLAFFVIGICFFLMALSRVAHHMPFIGPFSLNLAVIGATAACVFSFMLWNRNRSNLGWLAVFFGVFAVCAIYDMLVSGGRRPLMSLCFAPVICIYSTQARNWSRAKLFVVIGLSAVAVLSVGAVYSKFRWYNKQGEGRTASGVIQQMHKVRETGDLFSAVKQGGLGYVSQSNALFALLTKRYISQGALTPSPLNTLRVLITYPIPRKWWPAKPQAIGIKVVHETSHIPNTNWGLGFAGQIAYEGGILAIIVYAALLVVLVRAIDEPVRLQPDNPFLIFLYATVLPNIAGIPRGDVGLFTAQVLQGVLLAMILGYACRLFFGTKQSLASASTMPVHPSHTRYPVAPGSHLNH